MPYESENQVEVSESQRYIPSDGNLSITTARKQKLPTRVNKFGLLPLFDPDELARLQHECSPEELFPVDIIAIHGIDGDAYNTWTHDNGYFWLRDTVPKRFPGARVYSYGYPVNIFMSLEEGGFDSYARGLLWDIAQERRTPEVRYAVSLHLSSRSHRQLSNNTLVTAKAGHIRLS